MHIFSLLFHSYATLWLGHHNKLVQRERERERERCEQIRHWTCWMIIYITNQPTSWRKMYSAQRTVWVRYCITQLCHKLDERGNPYHGWSLTHDICQRSLLCETHGWIFTHKVRRESFTMTESWVNFHPKCTPWNCYYIQVMGEFLPTAYMV